MSKSPFLKSVADYMQLQRYSRRTIDTYLYWIKLFILFNGKQHPSVLGDEHIARFLPYLATERHVSAATQALALNAIVFLKTKFLGQQVGELAGFRRAERRRKLPVVLTQVEVPALLAALMYGSGLRRIERVRLRVEDIDFDYIRTAQQQLGHADVKTTEIYTHVLRQGAQGVRSPLSGLSK